MGKANAKGDEFEYDVLISYPNGITSIIRQLVRRLEEDGLKVWFLDRDVKTGGSTTRESPECA